MTETAVKWWGLYDVPPGQWGAWRIGPVAIYAQAKPREWVLGTRVLGSALDDSLSSEIPLEQEPDRTNSDLSRHMVTHDERGIKLAPRLADRPFVVRPELPLFLMPGEDVILFVTTVVWITILTGAGDKLLELPALRPSDTWFGPNAREGELCYSSRTSARTDPNALGVWPHRATTPIEIANDGSDPLRIEQLRVPVPALALYENANRQLWTDTVSFVRAHGEHQAAELTVPRTSKHLRTGTTRLAEPRAPVSAGTIVRAFSRLLG